MLEYYGIKWDSLRDMSTAVLPCSVNRFELLFISSSGDTVVVKDSDIVKIEGSKVEVIPSKVSELSSHSYATGKVIYRRDSVDVDTFYMQQDEGEGRSSLENFVTLGDSLLILERKYLLHQNIDWEMICRLN